MCTKAIQNVCKNYTKHWICIYFVAMQKLQKIKILYNNKCTENIN